MKNTKDAQQLPRLRRNHSEFKWTIQSADIQHKLSRVNMKIFLIFLLLFNISFDPSRAYFYQSETGASKDSKQCFCEVSVNSRFHQNLRDFLGLSLLWQLSRSEKKSRFACLVFFLHVSQKRNSTRWKRAPVCRHFYQTLFMSAH